MDQGTGRSADRRTGDSSEAEPRAAAADGRPAPYAYLGAPEPERTDHLAVLRVFRAAAPLAGLSASEVSERLGGRPGPAAVEARAQQLALWGNLLRVPQDTSSPDVPRYRLTALGERVQREAEAVLDAPPRRPCPPWTPRSSPWSPRASPTSQTRPIRTARTVRPPLPGRGATAPPPAGRGGPRPPWSPWASGSSPPP
ncbi:DUF2397 family protein [Streptomyces sp. SCUT-3]|nr:DUF2397 family protein [Streptomyces sp. SCUT-3]